MQVIPHIYLYKRAFSFTKSYFCSFSCLDYHKAFRAEDVKEKRRRRTLTSIGLNATFLFTNRFFSCTLSLLSEICNLRKGLFFMSKHLSLSERSIIESMLSKDFTFAQIAKKLNRTASTISREVYKHRVFTGKFDNYTHNDCIYFFSCLKNTVCPKHPTHGCFTRCKLCS